MPLQLQPSQPATRQRILSGAAPVFSNGPGILPQGTTDLRLVSLLPVQRIPIASTVLLKTGQSEGIRALFASNGHIVASLDFYYSHGNLRFSHATTGRHLEEMVAGLNSLAQHYADKPGYYEAACLDFHYADHPYFLAWSGSRAKLYSYFNARLVSIPHARFKTLIKRLAKKRKNSP